jgi:hypothetical protein
MKHMFTNAPASYIEQLPERFITIVRNSRIWKWERSEGLQTTGCIATLFPKDYTQDASFTIWCSQNDAYQLSEEFGMQLTLSSGQNIR